MSFYGKIFSSMYEGTLYGEWQAIVTFQQMIVLADPEGYIDMTPQAIAARTSIPLDIITKGIEVLLMPDPQSRTPDCEGRRIESLDPKRPWGWRIVNHAHYRRLASAEEKREADRLRIAEKREAERAEKGADRGTERFHDEQSSQPVAECRELSLEVAEVAQAGSKKQEADKTPLPPKGGARFDEFWRAYPRKLQKGDAERAWKRKKLDVRADEILGHLRARVVSDRDWLRDDGKFIPYPASWLNSAGWLDEYAKATNGHGGIDDGTYL